MTVWVSGATGFLGSHVVLTLARAGHDLRAVSRSGTSLDLSAIAGALGRSSPAAAPGALPGHAPPKGSSIGSASKRLDLTDMVPVEAVDVLDEEAVRRSAEGCTEAIICTGKVSREPGDAGLLHEIHVAGTRTQLRALRQVGVRRVVYASTSGTIAVSRDNKRIDDEQSGEPLEHISSLPYYRSKYFGEKEALAHVGPDFDVLVVNPTILLGPGDLRESSTSDVRRFLEGAFVARSSGGLGFVDVRDVAEAMVAALSRGRSGERYLLNAANMTIKAFFSRLERVSGVKAPLLSMPKSPELSGELFSLYESALRKLGGTPPISRTDVTVGSLFWYCTAEKAERELGFRPRDPGETLRDTVLDLVRRHVVAPKELRHLQSGA